MTVLEMKKARIGKNLVCNYLKDDKYIGSKIAQEKYEPYLTKLMLEQVKEGGVVVDVGANIGYYSLLFAEKVGKSGKVYAFEPEERNFEILKKNIAENKLENVVAVRAGLGSKEGEMRLNKSEENFGDHRMFEENSKSKIQSKKEKVHIYKLDDYLKKQKEKRKINLIKIDTQGWEPEVVRGAEGTIKRDEPIMFWEYWPWAYKKAGLDKKRMMDLLRKVYGQINFVEEYVQVYFPIKKEKLEKQIPEDREDLYGNLWVKAEMDWKYWKGSVKDFWLKKMMKRILGKPKT